MVDPRISDAPPMTDAQREAVKSANAADQAWFRANPDRHHLIRRPYSAEVPPYPGLSAMVLIKQVRPGAHLRQAVYLARVPPGDPPEHVARVVWDRTLANDPDMARLFASAEADILGETGA